MMGKDTQITQGLIDAVMPYMEYSENTAYIIDPLLKINRTRVNAEFCRSLLKIDPEKYKETIAGLVQWILANQNNDGSWNEEHPNYNKPSALITAIVGETLLEYSAGSSDISIMNSLSRACNYILSQEFAPGYFKKSQENFTDCLNVNATCGAFLAEYGLLTKNSDVFRSAKNAAHRVCYYQYSNGAYPYTPHERGYPYKYHFDVPCVHYQGVTLFYLSKIYQVIPEPWLKESMLRGTKWLAQVQNEDGHFDWSKSGLMFAYYLTGAYAFAYAVFSFHTRWIPEYQENASKCLNILERNCPSYALRWETASWTSFFVPRLITLRSAWLGDYPLRHRLFRIGYGYYHQISRRRVGSRVDEKTFLALCRILHISSSTIEPTNNFPDMFMTSEILDCLSSARCDVR